VRSAIRSALLAGRRRPVVRGGMRPYPRRGDGFEISELRAYVEGDDPRRIDWAATARAGALQVRVLLEEHALFFGAIVDDSASLDVGRRRSLRAAAYDALDAWALAVGPQDRIARILSSDVDAPHLFGVRAASRLRERYPPGPFDLTSALRLARFALPKDAALLVISDFYTTPDDDLLRELGTVFDVTALAARDPWRDGLPLRGFVRIRDAESGAAQTIYLGARAVRRYLAAVRRREEQLHERLERSGWRVGFFDEAGGSASLHAAFGLSLVA
jgi:uncharacterized protein (DUF58 family)